MFAMTSADRRLLEAYKAIGTPEEIRRKLGSPYPLPESGYAPIPFSDHEELHLGEGPLEEEDPPIVDDPWADK